MSGLYCIVRSEGNKPFVIESQRHEGQGEFQARVFNNLIDSTPSDYSVKLTNYTLEFIFEEAQGRIRYG